MTIRTLATFAEIESAFRERAGRMVWAVVATVDTNGRPSTRILHPVWEGDTGWTLTCRNSIKSRNLAVNPSVSVDAVASWG